MDRKRPSEAPERIRVDIYQGGGTQAGNEAVQRAAAGSSAWPPDPLPGDQPGSGQEWKINVFII